MSENAGIEGAAESAAPQDAEAPLPPSPEDQVRGNPAWGEILDKTPSQLHPMMIPVFQKWDKNFQDVQSRYAPYKDYVDNNVSPDDIGQALQITHLLNNNPRAVFDEMVKTFGETWGVSVQEAQQAVAQQLQGVPQNTDSYDLSEGAQQQFDITKDPRYQEMQQKVDTVANYWASQIQEQENAEVEAALDREVEALEQKYGQFNKQIVYSLAANGMPLEQAVQVWKNDVTTRQPSPGSNYPPVMAPGGGSPSQAVDVSSISSKDTIGLVKSWIQQANKES